MSFLFTLLYLVLTFLRPQEWVNTFKGQPLVDILAVAIGVAFLIERALTSKKFVWVPQNGLIVILFGAILLSHVTHAYLQGVLDSFAAFLPNLILYFLLLNTIQTVRQLRTALALIIALNVVLVFQGIDQLDHGYGWAGQPPVGFDRPDQANRITWIGIFNDPNDLALSFVVSIALALAIVFGSAGIFVRILSFAGLGLLLYGVYLTNSRGGLVALGATILFYVGKRTRHLTAALLTGVALLPLLLLFAPSRALELSEVDASASGRLDAWYHGLQLLKANPLLGAGHGLFTDNFSLTAHNSYLLAAAELGLIGLFCWMGLIYVSYAGLSRVSDTSALGSHALGLQSALIGFSVAAFFLSRTYTIVPYLLFALSGSVMASEQREEGGFEYTFGRTDVRNIAYWSVGVVLLAYVGLKVGL